MRIVIGVLCIGCIVFSFFAVESLRRDLEWETTMVRTQHAEEPSVVTGVTTETDARIPKNLDVPEVIVDEEHKTSEDTSQTPIMQQAEEGESFASAWKHAKATTFWVGEDATSDNGFIHNSASAWDEIWETHFGGVDDPETRCGYHPCGFTPKQNPFYVALPYNDFDDEGNRKANASRVPWFDDRSSGSLLENRWVEVRRNGVSCFGQWQDVGPFEEDDVEYVFGDAAAPKNTTIVGAGIDLSPALSDCLSLGGLGEVEWRHVATERVVRGPWTDIVTH